MFTIMETTTKLIAVLPKRRRQRENKTTQSPLPKKLNQRLVNLPSFYPASPFPSPTAPMLLKNISRLVLLALVFTTWPSASHAFKMTVPYSVPWVAVIDDFDITDPNNEEELEFLIQECFQRCPVIIFRKKNISDDRTPTAKQFFAFVKRFDPDVDLDAIEKQDILHPYPREPDEPHVGKRTGEVNLELRGRVHSGPLWRMNLVGSKKTSIPNVVSAFQVLDVPEEGGQTIFACMDTAYAMLPPALKKKVDELQCVFDNDMNSLFDSKCDSDGFTRLGPFPEEADEDQVIRPLVHRDKTTRRKRIFFAPKRFNRFVGWSREESWELMAYIFHTFVNTASNSVCIKWEKGDVVMFNNHKMIHKSTPWELYRGKHRMIRICFLNSKKMVEDDEFSHTELSLIHI